MSFEMNKIAGAILGTLLLVMGLGFLAEAIYAPIEGRGPGYALPEPEAGDHGEEAEVVEATPLPVLLASASAEDGASSARKCASCHNFGEGEGNKTGPELYGVVGNQIASHEGFSYSDALVAYGAENGNWTYETLAAFIHDPRGDVPGTKMTFAGIRDEEELADILAYLQTLSASPVPFPEVEEVAAEEPVADEAAADDQAAPEDMAEDQDADAAAEEPAAEETAEELAAEEATDDPAAENDATEEPVAEEDDAAAEEEAEQDEPAAEEPAADDAAADDTAEADGGDVEAAIASASPEDGESVMRNCRACHDWVETGRNKVGPLLYDVVGRDIASAEGYNYSESMQNFAAENGVWTYELLDTMITNPRALVPGTKMTFAGLPDADDRAAAIAFLRTQSPDPVPLAGAE